MEQLTLKFVNIFPGSDYWSVATNTKRRETVEKMLNKLGVSNVGVRDNEVFGILKSKSKDEILQRFKECGVIITKYKGYVVIEKDNSNFELDVVLGDAGDSLQH